MPGKSSSCFYSWLVWVILKEGTRGEEVEVLVLLPKNDSYQFSAGRVQPALDYARRSLHSSLGLTFNLHYEDSECGNAALFHLLDRALLQRPQLLLGPVCEYAVAQVARVAAHWNVPLVSMGARASAFGHKQPEYAQLTRLAPPHARLAEGMCALAQRFGWQTALLLYEEESQRRDCYFVTEALHEALQAIGMGVELHTLYTREEEDEEEEDIIKHMHGNEVVIMCAGGEIIRNVMLAAHRGKLTNGSHIFFNIELFNSSYYGDGSWRRGDHHDSEAKQAYSVLNTLTLLRSMKPQFEDFLEEVQHSLVKAGVAKTEEDADINMFVEGFHDALVLYALALGDVLNNGSSIKDGKQITQHMWNRTFEGIAGPVSIDANGDRHGDFSVMSMTDLTAGTHSAVINYFGINGSLQTLPGFNSNKFLLTKKDQNPPKEANSISYGLSMSTVVCIVSGIVIGISIVMGIYIFRKNYNISIERRCEEEEYSLGKHQELHEDAIRCHFSMV